MGFRGRGTGLPLRGGGERRTGWPPPSTPRSLPRGRRRPRKPRSSSAGGLLPFASPSAPCPASRRLILALHAEEINSRKPQKKKKKKKKKNEKTPKKKKKKKKKK